MAQKYNPSFAPPKGANRNPGNKKTHYSPWATGAIRPRLAVPQMIKDTTDVPASIKAQLINQGSRSIGSRGPRPGGLNVSDIRANQSKVRATRPTLPGQHTPAQKAYIDGDLMGRTYQQVNPYASTKESKFGSGGGVVSRRSWLTYLPVEQHKDRDDMKVLNREKEFAQGTAGLTNVKHEQAKGMGEGTSAVSAKGLMGLQLKPRGDAPTIRPQTAQLSTLHILQQRNEDILKKMKDEGFTKIDTGAKWDRTNASDFPTGSEGLKLKENELQHYIPKRHQPITKYDSNLNVKAQRLVKNADFLVEKNQQIRKPVLFNPLAKKIKRSAEEAALQLKLAPKVVSAAGPEINYVSSDGSSNTKVIPPPPMKKPTLPEGGMSNHGKVAPAPPTKKPGEEVLYDYMGNLIERQDGFPTSVLTDEKLQEEKEDESKKRAEKYFSSTGVDLTALAGPSNTTSAFKDEESGPSSSDQPSAAKKAKKQQKNIRSSGGETWEDKTLDEWGANDFRIFVGDLGQEVTDELLAKAFSRYVSFKKAKVIIDKTSRKPKGYGFVALGDPDDYIKAMREMQGHYIGARPVKLKKSSWKDRNLGEIKKKNKMRHKWGFKV